MFQWGKKIIQLLVDLLWAGADLVLPQNAILFLFYPATCKVSRLLGNAIPQHHCPFSVVYFGPLPLSHRCHYKNWRKFNSGQRRLRQRAAQSYAFGYVEAYHYDHQRPHESAAILSSQSVVTATMVLLKLLSQERGGSMLPKRQAQGQSSSDQKFTNYISQDTNTQ